ncbi:MAG: DUF2461 domain-containing protein [Bacteroidota bacterium]|nr:DUF2461 domain-containing protein [Bacteroidota bacterium]MDX5430510.1 DUF2461 domain-containing protein [Bacteroidota bacterium]MDX5469266.1 DUF2461 domain-containing protein [Bacteroidota bacterium]
METIIPFLIDLSANNTKEWFTANKKRFEQAKKEVAQLVDTLIQELAKEEPALKDLSAKDCMFRIYRDVRFSKNKEPYKTNMGAVIAPGGRKSSQAFYYLHLDPAGCFLAGGRYMPESDEIKNIRQEIDYNLDEFEKILSEASFKKHFKGLDDNERLKTTPKGYDADNPAIEYLKNKSFTVSYPFEAKAILKKDFVSHCVEVYQSMRPFNAFLNRATALTD